MITADRISLCVRQLPERLQAEVLDFIERLLARVEREQVAEDEREWTRFSLSAAMRDMEEDGPVYTDADLRERF